MLVQHVYLPRRNFLNKEVKKSNLVTKHYIVKKPKNQSTNLLIEPDSQLSSHILLISYVCTVDVKLRQNTKFLHVIDIKLDER